jgi:hypothetical protein
MMNMKVVFGRVGFFWGGMRLSPVGTSTTFWLRPAWEMYDDMCEAVRGMRIDRRNRNTWR